MRWFAPSFAVVLSLLPNMPADGAPRLQDSPTPPAFAPKYLEQIPLKYSDPALVAKTLNSRALPEGVLRVQVDPKVARTLRVLGTQEGIATIRAAVSLIDVQPRQESYRVKIERVRFGGKGMKSTTTVGDRKITFTHNIPQRFDTVDSNGATLMVSITVRLPQARETPETVLAEFGWRDAKGASVGMQRAIPLPKRTRATRIIGVTFADDANIVSTVGVGKGPAKWDEPFTAYYVSLQPVAGSR